MIILRIAVGGFAIILMIVGILLTPLPIPFGIVTFLLGFFLLASVAPSFVRGLRKRWRWFDRLIHALEKRLPRWMAEPLRATDHSHEEDEEARPARRGRTR